MRIVLLDTVGLTALWDESDQWNEPAGAAMKLLDNPGTRLVATSQILLECANSASRRPYRADVCDLRDRLIKKNDLIESSVADIEIAWAAYRLDRAGGASIVDHISFIVMRRLGVTDAFTNDRHFKTAGFNTLF